MQSVKKLYIEDWTRKGLGYDTVFEGELYHLVQDRNKPGFKIETNTREVVEFKMKPEKQPDFGKIKGRRDSDYTLSLNDSRFEIINKSPNVLSSVPRVPGFSFSNHKARPEKLFGNTEISSFYDSKIALTVPRLDAGVPKLQTMQPRRNSTQLKMPLVSCVDIEKVVEAKTFKLRPKQVNLTMMKSTRARDESILKTDDRWYNNQLENTKEQRQMEIEARASQYRNPPLFFNR